MEWKSGMFTALFYLLFISNLVTSRSIKFNESNYLSEFAEITNKVGNEDDIYESFTESIDITGHNPCNDFYKYTCHNFDQKYSKNEKINNYYGILKAGKVEDQKRKVFFDDAARPSTSRVVNLVRKLGDACMEINKLLSTNIDDKQSLCSKLLDDMFSPVIDHLYANKYRNDDIKRAITKMFDNLKLSAHKMIEANKDWLDISKDENNNPRKIWSGLSDGKTVHHTPSEHAHEKINKMTLYFGSFDPIMNENNFDALYIKYIEKLEKNVTELNAIPKESEAEFKKKYETITKSAQNYKSLITFEVARKGKEPDGTARMLSINSRTVGTRATTVNGKYMPELNGIFVPFGILQPPFFSLNYPDAINYGRIGSILSHEITHAFDGKGSMFDSNGDYIDPNSKADDDQTNSLPYDETKPHAWMSNEARKEFEKKDLKVQEVYSRQPHNYYCAHLWDRAKKQYKEKDKMCPEEFVDGELTAAENVADQGGIRIAYDAFMSLKDNERSPNELPSKMLKSFGIKSELFHRPKTNDLIRRQKLFFVSFGTINCDMLTGKERVQSLIGVYIKFKDFHAPNYLRVNTVLANYKEFVDLHRCNAPKDQKMMAHDGSIVTLWKLDTINK